MAPTLGLFFLYFFLFLPFFYIFLLNFIIIVDFVLPWSLTEIVESVFLWVEIYFVFFRISKKEK